jgi:hypothetical protein
MILAKAFTESLPLSLLAFHKHDDVERPTL